MRILIYSLNYYPELTGIGKYSGEMAAWLNMQGHRVSVVTTPPYYPSWKIGDGYSAHKYKVEQLNGIEITRCPLWVPKKVTGVIRIFHLLSFAASSFPVMVIKSLFWRADVILVVEPAFFCVPTAWICARLSGAKSWLHIQDFEIDAAFDLGLIKAGFLRRFTIALERCVMQHFDTISTISEGMFERLLNKGINKNKCIMFENWVDTTEIYPLLSTSPMRAEHNISDDTVVLLYSGNMGEKQGLELIIDAAQALAYKKDLLFVLCGDGVVRQRLINKAENLKNILFMPLQPRERLNELLNFADIHLLPQRVDVQDLVMPSKLLGMFASGRPVIATAKSGTQIAKIVEGCGLTAETGDPQVFTSAILNVVSHPDHRKRYGLNARAYAKAHWEKTLVLGRFERSLKELLN